MFQTLSPSHRILSQRYQCLCSYYTNNVPTVYTTRHDSSGGFYRTFSDEDYRRIQRIRRRLSNKIKDTPLFQRKTIKRKILNTILIRKRTPPS